MSSTEIAVKLPAVEHNSEYKHTPISIAIFVISCFAMFFCIVFGFEALENSNKVLAAVDFAVGITFFSTPAGSTFGPGWKSRSIFLFLPPPPSFCFCLPPEGCEEQANYG